MSPSVSHPTLAWAWLCRSQIVAERIHRVYIVDRDEEPRVQAVITPTDILRWVACVFICDEHDCAVLCRAVGADGGRATTIFRCAETCSMRQLQGAGGLAGGCCLPSCTLPRAPHTARRDCPATLLCLAGWFLVCTSQHDRHWAYDSVPSDGRMRRPPAM